jgi:hypothetical protein
MKFNLLLILGIIASSLFNFTSIDSPESWIIMPPAPIMRIIENYKMHQQVVADGAIPASGLYWGIDVDAANEFLMFMLVVILICRELIKKPVSKYFTFGFFAVFALSFLLMLTIGGWTLGAFGTWLFMISVCGLLVWQYLESKRSRPIKS